MSEREHVIYRMPYRVLRKLSVVTDWSWKTRVEYGSMVYGNRDEVLSVNTGIIRRGTPKEAEVKFIEKRRSILMFHNHPPYNKTLPSTGDVRWVLWFNDNHDQHKSFEAFAIGMAEATDEGRVTFYMVVDWDKMREVCEYIKEPSEEYGRYCRGLRPDIPPEVYGAQDYLLKRLHLFTRRRHLRYHPPVEVPKIEISDIEYVEPYTWDDVVKIVQLMGEFPEMELGVEWSNK